MTSPAEFDDGDYDEETSLLRAQSHNGVNATHRQTQLPTAQVSVLVLLWIAESIVASSISPYINQVRM